MSSAARDPRKNPEPGWWVAPFVFYLIVGFAIQVKVDSVYRRDSVFVREKGDTVFIYKERIRDRYVFRHDTLRLVKVDSVAVERVKEVKVEKPLSAWKSAKIGAFWWLVAAVLLLLLWTFRKPILKLLHL